MTPMPMLVFGFATFAEESCYYLFCVIDFTSALLTINE